MAVSTPVTIDGVEYNGVHVVSIKRNFQVLDGENAGRVKTGRMERDIIGTYYNYSIQFDPRESSPAQYDDLYERITSPWNSHVVVLPYGQTTLEFEAYVAQGSDELDIIGPNGNRWKNLTVNIIAMEPQKT